MPLYLRQNSLKINWIKLLKGKNKMSEILAPKECDDGFPEPRQFQITAHEALRQGVKDGHKNQIIMAPTGAGKTYLGLRICNEAVKKGKRALFLCDRTTLINQTSAVADHYGMTEHGIIQAQHWRRRSDALFQIASIQTIAKRNFWPQVDVLVVDECFPGDTLISTPDGLKEIRTLHSGELIYNSLGVAKIDSVFSKPSNQLCKVRLANGTSFRCTPDHPIFTRMGWKPAGTLGIGEELFCLQDMQSLWKYNVSKNGKISEQKTEGSGGSTISQARNLWEILLQEAEESDAQCSITRKNAKDSFGYGSQASCSRKQWTWHDISSENDVEKNGAGMDSGICCNYEKILQRGLSASLQSGHCQSGVDDRNRIGRQEPWFAKTPEAGSEERFFTSQFRVESIEIEERGCDELVYNLRVSGHPSYFANGVLVHNCHTTYKAWTKFAQATGAIVVGLSATPFTVGLGNIFTNIVNATTMHELTQSGVLVPMRIFSCRKPDMTGAATAGGEWTDKAAEERELTIVGDVVSDWFKYGEMRKTIIFGSTINHCKELCRRFVESGVMAAVFTSETTSDEREKLLEEYRKPDSALKILVSVEALAKGFDVPDVGCVCDARPLRKSLSTAIQMWGRGLRSSPETGKKDCLLLDFSGNIIRFFEDFNHIFFNGLGSLNDGDKLDKIIRKDEEEYVPKGCPKCGNKPFLKRCMVCGFEKIERPQTEAQSGTMTEIFIGTGKYKKKLAESPQDLWNQVCSYARFHSAPDKQAGRAWHLFKQITGTKSPFSFHSAPNVEITKNTWNKIQSMRIAYSRRRSK
jgi:superfamily II DNA or RNA helicase